MRVGIEKVPEPFQIILRRLVLSGRIFINRIYAIWNKHFRRLYRWWSAEPIAWVKADLSRADRKKTRIFCISLLDDARFNERRKFFAQNANKFGWPFQFWPAVNGIRFRNEEYPRWIKRGLKADIDEEFGAGAVGLLMTVRELYQWALREEIELLVVLEDDAVIHSRPVLDVPEEFDIVFFNNRIKGDIKGRVKTGWGNDGYVISRSGMEKMLEIMEFVTADIDMLMMMYTKSLEEYGYYVTKYRDTDKPQLTCYQAGPLVTHAGFFSSSIGTVNKETCQE